MRFWFVGIASNEWLFCARCCELYNNNDAFQVQSLCWEELLEKGMATHSSILASNIPWMEEPRRPQFMKLWRVGHDWATNTDLLRFLLDLRCSVDMLYIHCVKIAFITILWIRAIILLRYGKVKWLAQVQITSKCQDLIWEV